MAKKKAGAKDQAKTGQKDTNRALPEDSSAAAAATAELPFSDMIARWLDDGDKLHERAHEPNELTGEVAEHQGRIRTFVENARAQAHRHRRVISGAALLVVIMSVVAFRRANVGRRDIVSVDSSTASAVTVVAELPAVAPATASSSAPPAPTPPAAEEKATPRAPEVKEAETPTSEVKVAAAPVPEAKIAEAP